MDRSKLAKYFLLFLAVPFAIYLLVQVVAGYIPPTEPYKKAPFQFEEAFNEQMARYGMSIDLDSVNYSYGDYISKTIPITCEDGSNITCKIFTTSDRRKALIEYIIFKQELTGNKGETVYLEQFTAFIMDAFLPGISKEDVENPDSDSYTSYQGALKICREFISGYESEQYFYVAYSDLDVKAFTLNRETDEKTSLSVRIHLWH